MVPKFQPDWFTVLGLVQSVTDRQTDAVQSHCAAVGSYFTLCAHMTLRTTNMFFTLAPEQSEGAELVQKEGSILITTEIRSISGPGPLAISHFWY